MTGAAAAEAEARRADNAPVSELRTQVARALAALLHAVTCHVAAAATLVAASRRSLEVVVEIPAEMVRMPLMMVHMPLMSGAWAEISGLCDSEIERYLGSWPQAQAQGFTREEEGCQCAVWRCRFAQPVLISEFQEILIV